MSAFDLALDAQFADGNATEDAIWRTGGGASGVPVRVMWSSPQGIVGIGQSRFDLDAMLLSVRLSEIAAPASADEVDLLDDDGSVRMTVVVTGLAKIDTRRLVRTCEVSIVPDDAP